ncbi:putative actin-interacting protein 1, partial [Fasciolopsis buskii]
THNTFVNIVRYCPTGSCLASAGADGKIIVYDGADGKELYELGPPAHKGGVYGIAFSKDGSRMVSASADKTLKLWMIEGTQFTFLSEYTFGSAVNNMVLGCEWIDDTIVAVTFDTSLHLFHAPSGITCLDSPRAVYYGHSMHITCALFNPQLKQLITASSDAGVASWDMDRGLATMFSGSQAHTAQVQGMALVDDKLVTVGFDDRCVLSDVPERSFIASVKLPSQPHGIGFSPDQNRVLVVCDQHLVLLNVIGNSLNLLEEQPLALGACTVSVSPTAGFVVICCSSGGLFAFRIERDKLIKIGITNAPSAATVIASFSPDGSMLAFADQDRQVTVFNVHDNGNQISLSPAINTWWQKHTARITALSWSPNGRCLATGSLDTAVIVWSLDKPKDAVVLRNAHPMSNSTALSWMNDQTLVSTGHDGSIRRWKVTV